MMLSVRLSEALTDAGIVGATVELRAPDGRDCNFGFPLRVVLEAHDAERLIELLNERRVP